MKKGIVFPAMLLVWGLLLSGCASNIASRQRMFWHGQVIDPAKHDYTILGPVRVERDWLGVLGFETPLVVLGVDNPLGGVFIYERGGVNYVDVLDEARRLYPETDEVINLTYDYKHGNFLFTFIYTRRRDIVTGMAIRYAREQSNTWNRDSVAR